jgi:hypothetical protein
MNHVLSALALQSSHYWIDIVLLIDGVSMLANVVIVDSTWVYSFSWGCCENHGLSETYFLSQSIFDIHVSPFSYKGFLMFILASGWVFSSMNPHGMGNEGHWKRLF